VFTDARHNRYFYEVPAQFATAERPQYTPRGGFAGTQFLVALSKRYPKYWVGAFARYDTLRGARFEASPLVTSKGYFAVGFGISWIVGESSRRVPVTEFGERRR
jgi:outer membrane scaffolding protein for murein synthesis (MipA/OmpV family)